MRFVTSPDYLTLQLQRSEQIAALKAKITIIKKQIISITWNDTFEDWRRWEVRMPGSAIPNRLLAGSYWTEEGWDFLYIKRPVGVSGTVALNVIVIALEGHEKYKRVIVSATEEDYQHIHKWFRRSTPKKKKTKK
jgi:hypothetical protein